MRWPTVQVIEYSTPLKGSSPSPVVDMLEPWRVPGGRASPLAGGVDETFDP